MLNADEKSWNSETYFLPPLNMVLTFYDKTNRKSELLKVMTDGQKLLDEKNVEKLIEKLSEKEK